ncbi:hypothetical protein HPP92_019530 [Vanilla planifolia]|uniref:Uncharacterized protein n=1 Tax=Vanilla planifolia TaxID=51239 RepID=A0A835Q314_VANPL|nr:hypothetical protein HPP92_019530 [Vanilla planifolia]
MAEGPLKRAVPSKGGFFSCWASRFSPFCHSEKLLPRRGWQMKAQLSDKDTEAAFLRESFGTRLLQQQEEQDEQLRRLNEEEVSLSRQLTSTKDALAALDQQLQVERRLVEELKARRDQLEHSMRKAREEEKILEADCNEKEDRINVMQNKLNLLLSEINEKEKNIQNLKKLLIEKESECKNLNSNVEQAGAKLAAANSTIEQLKDTIFDARKELDTKSSVINDLHSKVKSLTEEKDVSNSKLYNLVKEYNDLISSTEKRDAFNSELLSKKDEQLHRLKEDLKLALSEIKSKQTMISELAKERDDVIASMEEEHNYTREAKNELQTNQELLATAMTERSEMSKELEEARTAYKEALTKISKCKMSMSKQEAQATSKVLSDELESAKEIIRLTENELNSASDELKAVIEERESSRKEFEDAYKLVETMSIDLKKKKQASWELEEELEVLRKQVMQDLEARKTLEVDLDNATRSLDEMNESNMLLSKELDYITSSSASLEAEKEMLYKYLAEQKYIAKEAQENIEDAHNLITRLGSEKENLERRFNRLVEEPAAAKGEILRLRRLISAGQESVNFHDTQAGTLCLPKEMVEEGKRGHPIEVDNRSTALTEHGGRSRALSSYNVKVIYFDNPMYRYVLITYQTMRAVKLEKKRTDLKPESSIRRLIAVQSPASSRGRQGIDWPGRERVEQAEEAFKALDLNKLRNCFGFDTFFAVDVRRFGDGGIFVGNLRKPIEEVLPKLERKLSEAAGREVVLWFMEEKKDDVTKQVCMVQPKAEIDLQFEVTKLSTPWGYFSAVALGVTTFGTIALMSGFFLKPGARFDDYVADVIPLFGGFLTILGVSEISTRITAARYGVKLSPSFLVPSNWTGCLGVINNYESLLPNKKALFDIPVARTASAYLASVALAVSAFIADGSLNGGDNAL